MGIFDFIRKAPNKKRSFAGINSGRLFNDFVTMSKSSDAELRPVLKVLRNRCRELARNDEYVRRYLMLMKTNVVGSTGIMVQAKARNEDGNLDFSGNKIIENAFESWSKKGNCTVDGRLSFKDAQRLVVETLARDGEVLIRFVRNYQNKDRFAIQFIEADLLDEELNQTAKNGNRIRMGVEIDEFGKAVAYHLLKEHPADNEFQTAFSRQHTRVDASEILHIFFPERPHQTRGVPPLSSAINSLKMLNGYREAELISARVSASKMGFITSPDGEGYTGDDVENSHSPIMSAEPGSFEQLPQGMDIKLFDPSHPTTAFADFHKALLRGVASSLGVSYASLASDLENVNYSSIRQGALDERDFYKTQQQIIIEHFIQPVFENWLQSAMSFSDMPLPLSKFEKFADNIIYRARGFSWIDPVKEINANVTAIQNGILSLQDVQSHYGHDVEDTFQQIDREKKLADQYNIKTAFEPFGTKSPTPPIIEES